MTAFARQSHVAEYGVVTWELRAVNHRFLEISIRLPENLRALEFDVREKLSKKCHRGKIEAILKISAGEHIPALMLNEKRLQQLSDAEKTIRRYFSSAQTDVFTILNWPGVLDVETASSETLHASALDILQHALEELVKMRVREGEQIKQFIQQKLHSILQYVNEIQEQIPELLTVERERMKSRLAEFDVVLEPQRLEQEIGMLLQKADIAEEIQRLHSHCLAMNDALNQAGAIGRRLDFLSQELHREANTLASKALNLSLTRAAIEMKVLIEQIREQVQNIE